MKALKHIINILIWTTVSLYLLLIIFVRIPYIQDYIGTQAAHLISEKIGSEVRIGRVDVGFLNRIILDDVMVFDQNGKEMMKAARLSARIDILPITEGKICISSAQILGTHFKLYQASENTKPNFQFVLDSLASKDTTDSSPLDLRVNTFIMQRSSVTFDRYDKPYTNKVFNPSHINIRDISAYISLKVYNQDSLNLAVKKLAFKEHSGLILKKLAFKTEGNRKRCRLYDFKLSLPETELNISEIVADYKLKDNKPDPVSLNFHGRTGHSVIVPSDLAFLSPVLKGFRQRLLLSSVFRGTRKSVDVGELSIKSSDNSLYLKTDGQLTYTNGKPSWTVAIDRFFVSQNMFNQMESNIQGKGHDIITAISKLGFIDLQGKIHSHSGKQISAESKIKTNSGNIDMKADMLDMTSFHGTVSTEGFDMKPIMGDGKVGHVIASLGFDGHVEGKKIASVKADGTISELEYKDYKYSNITFNGDYAGDIVSGKMSINDPNAEITAEGTMSKQRGISDISIDAMVKRIVPQAINLTKKWGNTVFSAGLTARFNAASINDAVGSLSINDFVMEPENDDIFIIKNINVSSGYDSGTHFVTLDSDFGHAELKGQFDYGTLDKSLANLIKSKLPTVPGIKEQKIKTRNDFTIDAHITDTEWLEHIAQIPLDIRRPVSLTGSFSDGTHSMNLSCTAPHFFYDGKEYRNSSVSITSPADTLHGDIKVSKIMDNGDVLSIGMTGNALDNKLMTSVKWSNKAKKKQHGMLNTVTQFADDSHHSAYISIEPSHININDTIWNIHPSTITYKAGQIDINRFTIANNKQHIIIDGTASKSQADSVKIELNDIDIEYILDLVNFHSVDFSGRATGHAYITAPLSEISANGQIRVDNFKFEHGDMGTLNADVNWNKQLKQIDIQAIANDGPGRMTVIDGYVSPSRSYIDLGIQAEGTRIDFMQSFTSSFLDKVNGQARGAVRLAGPLSTINLTGQLVIDGEATVKALNCKYFLKNDTVTFIPDEIELRNIPLYDKYGNKGEMYGNIHHQHLTRLSYDLALKADNLLSYSFDDFGDNTFYGTVFGTGNVNIHGRSGEVVINVDVTPQKNSQFVYNVSNPDAIVNQEFIRWNSYEERQDTAMQAVKKEEHNDISANIHINFLINCTPDATIKLLMDSRANDYITLNGSGVIRASFYNKGSFNMFGTYTVSDGTYGITIQDIIKKNFIFNNGGKILFGGNPYEADLNLQAIHTVNGVSLSDLNIGNSFSSNTVRVNCLMNIHGTPKSPRIAFDLDIPNVSTDEKQMIRSIINSEDEMSQQVLYLLGVGRFYPKESNNAAAQNENQKSQTSLAMQSLLSSTISNQINNVLSTVINSKNWNFGANISTGNDGWDNAEYEGLLNGRLLNNRLLINGQFGYRDNASTANTSFIGDFDIRYLLYPNGNLAVNVYNKTNDRYFTKSSFNTQGIGLIMKKDFSSLKDLFNTGKKRKKKKSR